MKVFPDKETLNKKDNIKTIFIFIIAAFTAALITTFQKFALAEGLKIIAYSLVISAGLSFLYIKIDSILKIEKRMKKLSFGILLFISLLISLTFSNINSQFLKYLLFWISVELLSVGFLAKKYKGEANKSLKADPD